MTEAARSVAVNEKSRSGTGISPDDSRALRAVSIQCQPRGHFSLTHKHFSRITKLKMTRKSILVLAAASVLGLVCLRADTPQMSAADIKPGMVGVGRTVFDGTKIEEFKAHIIGVLSNVIGPRRNLILARLEGGPLANAGVIAGMSGSPVFIDG